MPPIDLAGNNKALKKSQGSISRKKSPKHYKHYSEDIRNNQMSKSPIKNDEQEQRKNYELEEQIMQKLYPVE